MAKRHTDNAEAYQLYLQALYVKSRLIEPALRKAIDYFQRAIAKDANDEYIVPEGELSASNLDFYHKHVKADRRKPSTNLAPTVRRMLSNFLLLVIP